MDREGPPDASFLDTGGKQRVVGRVVDAIGEAGQAHRDQQPGIAAHQAQRDEAEAAQQQAEGQHAARAEAVDRKTERRLHERGDDVEHAEREAEFDKADTELRGQQRQQRRQRHDVQVAHEVRTRHLAQQAEAGKVHEASSTRMGLPSCQAWMAASALP
jgi:hypothetical protein